MVVTGSIPCLSVGKSDRIMELEDIIKNLPGYQEALHDVREILLANAVMVGEIPAPTFGEENRVRFVKDRFTESDLSNVGVDEESNVMGILPGRLGKDGMNILVSAHVDTPFKVAVNHTITVGSQTMSGTGIADNSLGLATVCSLPDILARLGIELDANLVLLGNTKSLGEGDLKGLRTFLKHARLPFSAGVCIEGVRLGRLSYSSLGMVRGEITVTVPEERSWEASGSRGAIVTLNRIVTKMLAIPIPAEPRTSLILGSIGAGTTFNTPPTKASLRFEIRSEQEGMASQIASDIEAIVEEAGAEARTENRLTVVARRKPGGIGFRHPYVRAARDIMRTIGIKPEIAPSVGDLSALIDAGIPGITVGMTYGDNVHDFNESVEIEPVFSGLTQLVGMLQFIDGELKNVD